ncbi:MAG: hypothetical protein GWN99_02025 [Gemmatimonadetes bacterium]|uniref:Uncharacterized protein n=1 Tax=Candidatus Kutchimonas denitrificans TaxID=3056748 RepID=A0AAE5CB81_9BACT|nr:hypothetical protein [Gemmatimonadota bacterium]NIR74223.1 hypothetical protein [Candidatus Kutchimonas denitrificans]NIR99845.1 hypothetical protein [Gemmatimonadota bacterium]NIT65434.1 hypothetical protein [Gemmatimonadota bacterium]NIU51799.1 hypothetical protein [Gemmatimonadota bacterium]
MRSQRREVRYTRILGAGLAISLVVHGALLGLGRVSFGSHEPAEGSRDVVSVPAEAEPANPEISELAFRPPSEAVVLGEPSSPAGPDLSEYPLVLGRANEGGLPTAFVPRPRSTPLTVESGLTPIRMPRPTIVTMDGRGRQGNGIDGIDVTILLPGGIGHGGDSCVPRRRLNYFRQLPLAGGRR